MLVGVVIVVSLGCVDQVFGLLWGRCCLVFLGVGVFSCFIRFFVVVWFCFVFCFSCVFFLVFYRFVWCGCSCFCWSVRCCGLALSGCVVLCFVFFGGVLFFLGFLGLFCFVGVLMSVDCVLLYDVGF